MKKLVALYRTPKDPGEFDKHFSEVHTPLVKMYPGLLKLEVTRITEVPLEGTKYYLMAEMYFDSKESMDKALASKEGKAVSRDLMNFAAADVTIFSGDVV